jgi:hypothetical protein
MLLFDFVMSVASLFVQLMIAQKEFQVIFFVQIFTRNIMDWPEKFEELLFCANGKKGA